MKNYKHGLVIDKEINVLNMLNFISTFIIVHHEQKNCCQKMRVEDRMFYFRVKFKNWEELNRNLRIY